MQLHRLSDVTPDGTGLVCRKARWSIFVWALLFTAAPIAQWWFGAPTFLWVVCGLLAVLLLPLFVSHARACFRPHNWLLWIRPRDLLVNVRSYQDQSPLDSLTVVEIGEGEIASVSRHVERYTTRGSKGGTVRGKLESLDIRLTHGETADLDEAISASRRHPQPPQVYLGFIRVVGGLTHFSVSLPEPDLIRIAWRGGQGHNIVPSLKYVLAQLQSRFKIGEATELERGDLGTMSDADFDEQILELTRSGDRIQAISLLVSQRGYSMSKARQFVEELSARL